VSSILGLVASEGQDALFQWTAAFDRDESVALNLHDKSLRRPTHFAGTLRNDGVEDVANVALVAAAAGGSAFWRASAAIEPRDDGYELLCQDLREFWTAR
jgi:hypothetical protein